LIEEVDSKLLYSNSAILRRLFLEYKHNDILHILGEIVRNKEVRRRSYSRSKWSLDKHQKFWAEVLIEEVLSRSSDYRKSRSEVLTIEVLTTDVLIQKFWLQKFWLQKFWSEV